MSRGGRVPGGTCLGPRRPWRRSRTKSRLRAFHGWTATSLPTSTTCRRPHRAWPGGPQPVRCAVTAAAPCSASIGEVASADILERQIGAGAAVCVHWHWYARIKNRRRRVCARLLPPFPGGNRVSLFTGRSVEWPAPGRAHVAGRIGRGIRRGGSLLPRCMWSERPLIRQSARQKSWHRTEPEAAVQSGTLGHNWHEKSPILRTFQH
jgi:hypothetical protein